jgi:biopolymer transport protein ExbB/TolQ
VIRSIIGAFRFVTIRADAFNAFYRWLVLFGVLLFGVFLAYREQLLQRLLNADESYLSAIIILLFAIASLDAGRRAHRLGRELSTAIELSLRSRAGEQLLVQLPSGEIGFAEARGMDSFAHEHLLLLAEKTRRHRAMCRQDLLLERLENALGRGHETGWFVADLMIRLGLLGTVIGFIFMLGSVADVSSVDIHALQQLLTNMSGGMRIALYTTLTGLGAGMLLGLQYRLLDQAADRLMAEIIELSEVHIIDELREFAKH